ncbi:MAG: aquaporin family protein [Acidobacteria bacterium]|nr:MAG: aquaporin family protein [Acidobacteriota bacterium]
MNPHLAELIGTAIIIVFGAGVVANVVLARTKGSNSGWIVIAWGWAIGVFVGVACADASGAHLNPAISVSLALGGRFDWGLVPGYVAAQFAGAFLGALIVGFFYREHFKATDDLNRKLAVFCTAPNIRVIPQAFFCEVVATFFLAFPVFLISTKGTFELPGINGASQNVPLGLGSLGALPVALIVLGLGLALGGTTGYAINPARDLGPRLAHAVLPLGAKRDGDWSYAWVPVVGPLVGGVLAALLALAVL